nr:ROK family protein [Kineococcus aurantiacus]
MRLVHRTPGLTRAEAARTLGTSSGAATDAVATLVAERRLLEGEPRSDGRRGRPTRPLLPHPEGPLVLAGQVDHRDWRVRVVELGGTTVTEESGTHDGSAPAPVLDAVRAAARRASRRFGDRLRGAALAVPGPVREGSRLDAPLLGWTDVDLRAAWPGRLATRVVRHANDARCAGLAESVRGPATGAGLHLHLHLAEGLGGAVVREGLLLEGRHTATGEFGHLPLGDPAVRCGCGATGCWGTALGGDGDPVVTALARGTAGLVNSLDPDLVTLGGRAGALVGRPGFAAEFARGLMDVRRADPPPVLPAALGADGPVVGAAELVWDAVLR